MVATFQGTNKTRPILLISFFTAHFKEPIPGCVYWFWRIFFYKVEISSRQISEKKKKKSEIREISILSSLKSW
jgi:hypothetical protein